MQKLAQLLLVGCLFIIPAIAQRGGGFRGGMGGGFRGGMGGGFRGGMGGGFRGGMGGFQGGMGGFRGGGFVSPGFRGGFVAGGFRGHPGGFFRGNRFGFGYVPYWPYYYYPAYPSYGYGYGYGYNYYPYAAYSYPYSDTLAYSYPYQGAVYAYSQTGQTSCPQTNGRPLYLIKLTYQDKVWLAQDYWYTPGTLNFVTSQSELNKTPVNSIDRAVTDQLNRECGVDFQFPR